MNHFQFMKIIDYLHLFHSSGLIVKLSISQGSIPCNLCLFNIREFTLKKGVNKNFILLHPSFYLACPVGPPHLSLYLAFSFMFCLSYCPSPSLPVFPSFWHACPTTAFFLSLFLPCMSYYITHTFLLSLFFVLLQHTPFFLFSTLPILPHIHTHSLFLFSALLVLSHIHIISLFSSLSLFSCCHTHTSLFLLLQT